ncbi:MAG TPA: hypothetical protein PKL13_02955 [bacterium]|nr:hypothetical protein [bacterium]
MENKRKKIILLIILIIIFLLVFVIFSLFLSDKINFLKRVNPRSKNYLNIDKNKVIENPTKEDIKNLIDSVQDGGGL